MQAWDVVDCAVHSPYSFMVCFHQRPSSEQPSLGEAARATEYCPLTKGSWSETSFGRESGRVGTAGRGFKDGRQGCVGVGPATRAAVPGRGAQVRGTTAPTGRGVSWPGRAHSPSLMFTLARRAMMHSGPSARFRLVGSCTILDSSVPDCLEKTFSSGNNMRAHLLQGRRRC